METASDGFTLTSERQPSKKRGKTTAKDTPTQVEVAYAQAIVGWLNGKRVAAGKTGSHFSPYSTDTITRVRWIRKHGWPVDLVLQALDLRVDQWRKIGERTGEDWTDNLHPRTSLNGKLQSFIESAQEGERVQISPAVPQGQSSGGKNMLLEIAAEMRRRQNGQ